MKRPTMLMILDGFGLNPEASGNAIAQAHKPNLDDIFARYPGTKLDASGSAVGLPDGQMGNSEVGHLNIGAGRIVYQDLSLISNAIADGSFFENKVLASAMDSALQKGKTLHLLGLLSDGGVHSHIEHLKALLKMAKMRGLEKVFVHAFLDGRDVPPRCAKEYIEDLENYMTELSLGRIVLISGRYYAMDRDKRWDRVQLAYDAMTLRQGRVTATAMEAMDIAYANDENDEFVIPTCVGGDFVDEYSLAVQDGDSMIMYNFRPDRAREITRAFVDNDFDGFERGAKFGNINYVCMTEYDASMPNVSVAYPPERLENTFGEYIASLGLTQLRIAETEKYAHVTFFFNGGVEEPNKNEDRILVPSPKVATYDLQPEMSAYQVTDQVIQAIDSDKYDVIILNFANADMVGHTGIMEAAIKAIETLDTCVPRIVEAVLGKGGQILLTADHGNADVMLDEDGNVVTSHSLNPVPLLHIAEEPVRLADGGRLSDIAPTMLTLMGLPIPKEMTGKSLV
ncbi:MAG: 2,3-bisphosphoglycerate-independent phosphoglycerate mutase [Firmicutes bacterium]|nr:2,3-bisphosphoglycerate-independent phosphoglycerate mutase [Bacillota bacterium]